MTRNRINWLDNCKKLFCAFFLVFTSLSLCVVNGEELYSNRDSEDTIVIEAAEIPSSGSGSRTQRQLLPRPDEQHNYGQPHHSPFNPTKITHGQVPESTFRIVRKYDTCRNVKGQQGVCVPLKQCFTSFYGLDQDNDGIYERNTELAEMLTESVGSCDLQRTSGKFHYIHPGTRGGNIDLVCCTGNYSEVAVPTIEPLPSTLIVGGEQAAKGQFPFIVALMNNGRQFCGGSLIDSKHVLTAAHCVSHMGSYEVAKVTVQIGDHDIYSTIDGPHQVRKVARVIKHKRYNAKTLHNDIALLSLSTPVTTASNVKTVCLGSSSGSVATVSGWGRKSEQGTFPSILHFAKVNLWTNAQCKSSYGAYAPGGITDHMLCAGGRSTDACSGDSGGPLLVGGCQVGIVSWGIGCGTYPGVYTRVSSFSAWIAKNQKL